MEIIHHPNDEFAPCIPFCIAVRLRRLAEGSSSSKESFESFASLVLLDLMLMEMFESAPMIRMVSFGRLFIIFKTSLLNSVISLSE